MFGRDRLDGEPAPAAEKLQAVESGYPSKFGEGQGRRDRVEGADGNLEPGRGVWVAFGVVMVVGRIKSGGVGVGLSDNLGEAGDRRGIGIGVVEDDEVARLDLVSQEIAGLVVADAVPAGRLIGLGQELIERVLPGLGLEEPGGHERGSRSRGKADGSGRSGHCERGSLGRQVVAVDRGEIGSEREGWRSQVEGEMVENGVEQKGGAAGLAEDLGADGARRAEGARGERWPPCPEAQARVRPVTSAALPVDKRVSAEVGKDEDEGRREEAEGVEVEQE